MGLFDKLKNLDPMRGLDKVQEMAKKSEEKPVSTNTVTTVKSAFNPSAKFGQSDPNVWNKAEYDAWKKAQEKK